MSKNKERRQEERSENRKHQQRRFSYGVPNSAMYPFFVNINTSFAHIFTARNEVCEVYVFTGDCLSTPGWGRVWFYLGGVHGFIRGRVHGFIRGECVVLFGGHAWFFRGGMRGISGGRAWFFWGGACVVFQFFRIQ